LKEPIAAGRPPRNETKVPCALGRRPPDNGLYLSYIYNVMPTAPPPLKVFAAAAPMRCSSGKASICVLDDDPSMLKAVERLLKAEGFDVEKFSDPAAFLATIGQARCGVAILDVWMPDMNGLEVQATLRKDSPATRIIFITGRDDLSVRQAALDAGAFGFLTKPFDDEALLQLVRKAVVA
jgi:CheY-like chemotaxis protein